MHTISSMDATNRRKKRILWVCFLAYLLFLSYLLFFSSYFGRTERGDCEYRYNLTLFQEIGRYYNIGIRRGSWYLFIINVCGNIGVFVPVGIFLPMLIKPCKNVFFTVLICLQLSILVEITQLITKVGSLDVDDVLLNTLGGLCGYVIYRLVVLLCGRGKKQKVESEDT